MLFTIFQNLLKPFELILVVFTNVSTAYVKISYAK